MAAAGSNHKHRLTDILVWQWHAVMLLHGPTVMGTSHTILSHLPALDLHHVCRVLVYVMAVSLLSQHSPVLWASCRPGRSA